MPVDLDCAERFMQANARVLECHRMAILLRGAPAGPALQALGAYRNPDGGFGHALEPDVRAPHSEPAATLRALEVLISIGARDNPMVAGAAAWTSTVADPDGGVPFVMPASARYPHARWMVPEDGGSFLTFAIAGALWELGCDDAWLARGTEWCWATLERAEQLSAYWAKFAIGFLDRVPDGPRAAAALERLRPLLGPDGTVAVPGGTEGERLNLLELSERPDGRSRVLFTQEQVEADLDRLEAGQREDGGWTFDWLGWSPGQAVEWRGIVTLEALSLLLAHGRIERPGQAGGRIERPGQRAGAPDGP